MARQLLLTEATTDQEAARRFAQWGEEDPFPTIAEALLNSSDIYTYALATGMIHPFSTNEANLKEKLKSASYEVDFLGDVYYKEDGKEQTVKIEIGKRFELKKNSIAFVFLKTQFRIPDYIALRFNLRITHVHKGLLLGTGPLVDPGFVGRLLVPLHNLTSNNYILTGGEGLIWVEFTKLSLNPRWTKGATNLYREYSLFPRDKRDLPAYKYFDKASFSSPAESSIPEAMREAKQRAESAEKSAKWLARVGVFAIAAALISILSLVHDANKNITDSARDNAAVRERLVSIEDKIKALEAERKPGTGSMTTSLNTRRGLNGEQNGITKTAPPNKQPE